MRQVNKGPEPPELLAYRKSEDVNRSYPNFEPKAALRAALLRDQQHLCCYCMRRIKDGSMKIEHYRSQHAHTDLQLDWPNMLGACEGGQGQPPRLQTCDTRKGDRELTVDPRDAVDRTVRYTVDGRLLSDDPAIQDDLDDVLNLNLLQLQHDRRNKLGALADAYQRKFGRTKRWTKETLVRELERLAREPKLEALAGVAEWWLREQLRHR